MLSVWGLKHGKSCCAPTNLCGPGLYDDARNILLSLQDLELLETLSSRAFKVTYGFIGPLNLGYHCLPFCFRVPHLWNGTFGKLTDELARLLRVYLPRQFSATMRFASILGEDQRRVKSVGESKAPATELTQGNVSAQAQLNFRVLAPVVLLTHWRSAGCKYRVGTTGNAAARASVTNFKLPDVKRLAKFLRPWT